MESENIVLRYPVNSFLAAKWLEFGRRQLTRDSLKFYSSINTGTAIYPMLSWAGHYLQRVSLLIGLQGSSQKMKLPAFRTCLCFFGKKLGGSCTFIFISPRLLLSPKLLWKKRDFLSFSFLNSEWFPWSFPSCGNRLYECIHTVCSRSSATRVSKVAGWVGRRGVLAAEYNSPLFEANSVVLCFSQEVSDLSMGIFSLPSSVFCWFSKIMWLGTLS